MTEEYLHLFNAVSSAIEQLEILKSQLIDSQTKAEELYLERTD